MPSEATHWFLIATNVEPMRRWGRRDCEAVTRYQTSQRAQNLKLR